MKGDQIWRVHADSSVWQTGRYTVFEGSHRWKLPSLRCSACGVVWGDGTVCYPWVDLSSLPNQKPLKGNVVCVVSAEELELYRGQVRPLLGVDLPLPPATNFGPFKGRHTAGKVFDFNLFLGEHMLSRAAYEKLREKGTLSLGATAVQVKNRKGEVLDYVELHVLPRAELGAPKIQEPRQLYCQVCGFDQRSLPEPLVIRRSSIPAKEEVFQLKDNTGVLLCTESFRDSVLSLGLTGIQFEPVSVV
ncbi:MAG: hypothetical protein GX456_19125 [Verrucomicrobia bacterium]|nr:hypothetical protein [Verrucomicrobiota bacterium]